MILNASNNMDESINMFIQEIFITFCPGCVSHISTTFSLDNDKTFISCKERKHNVSYVDAVRPPLTKTRYIQTAGARQRQKVLRLLVSFAADTWAVTQ